MLRMADSIHNEAATGNASPVYPTGCSRTRKAETASSETDCTRDFAPATVEIEIARLSVRRAIWRARRGFPCPELEAADGDPSREEGFAPLLSARA